MQERTNTTPQALSYDPFGQYYCEPMNCYRFQSVETMPSFNISEESIIHAVRLQPNVDDLIVCRPSTRANGFIIGRLVKKKDYRIALRLSSGVCCVVSSSHTLVITEIR